MRYHDCANRVPPAGPSCLKRARSSSGMSPPGKRSAASGSGKRGSFERSLAPDGKTLGTGTSDKTIRLWDLATLQEIRRFGRGDAEPYGIAFSPDGTKLASTEGLGPDFPTVGENLPLTAPIRIWDTTTGREVQPMDD